MEAHLLTTDHGGQRMAAAQITHTVVVRSLQAVVEEMLITEASESTQKL